MRFYSGTRTVGEIQSETTQQSEEIEPVCVGNAVAVPPAEPFIRRSRKASFFMRFYYGTRTVGEIQSETTQQSEEIEPVCVGNAVAAHLRSHFKEEAKASFFVCFYYWMKIFVQDIKFNIIN